MKILRPFLLLFLLSPLAIAGTVNYDTGTFQSGKLTGSFSSFLRINITGSLGEVDIRTGPLMLETMGCPTGSTCYDFSSGFVAVDDGSVFTDAIIGGIAIKSNGVATISATLDSTPRIDNGAVVTTFDFSGKKILGGSGDVSFDTHVPEPSALLSLGLGLLFLFNTAFDFSLHRYWPLVLIILGVYLFAKHWGLLGGYRPVCVCERCHRRVVEAGQAVHARGVHDRVLIGEPLVGDLHRQMADLLTRHAERRGLLHPQDRTQCP